MRIKNEIAPKINRICNKKLARPSQEIAYCDYVIV